MDPNESKEEEFSDNESIDSDERELDEVAELIEEEEHQPSEPEYDSGDESSENENLPPLNEIVQFVEKEEECERLVQRKLTVNDKTKWTTESGFGPSGRWGRAAARRPKAEGSEVSIEKAVCEEVWLQVQQNRRKVRFMQEICLRKLRFRVLHRL